MTTTTTWTFTDTFEGWIFDDISPSPCSGCTATRSHVAGAIRNDLTLPQIPTVAVYANNRIVDLEIPVVANDSIEFDYGAPSDADNTGFDVEIEFTDATTEKSSVVDTGSGTLTHTVVAASKTLDTITVTARRSTAGSPPPEQNFTVDVLEVRLITASPPPPITGSGERPLELDMDLETGAKIWSTVWDGGELQLREYSSALALQNTFSIATGTLITEIDSRQIYSTPYAPPFFGVASLDDIIYIFGRWDDGTLRHLQKSTNGGSSFSDIGDSGTWGDGWVGGFFADDANILYAFVNGGSRALYRSINAGSSWTSLSSLPFDVDPGGVSKHPDGRILISNRDAGAQTAAYAHHFRPQRPALAPIA
jgi:hypothetical protein